MLIITLMRLLQVVHGGDHVGGDGDDNDDDGDDDDDDEDEDDDDF